MEKYKGFKEAGMKMGGVEMSKSSQNSKYYESITLESKEFPYLDMLAVGSECELKIKAKKSAERMSEHSGKDKNVSERKLTIEILKVAEPEGIPKEQKKYKVVAR